MMSVRNVFLSVALLALSGVAVAQTSAKQLSLANIESVSVKKSFVGRGMIQEVIAVVSYGNSCTARVSEEAVLVNYGDINSRTLEMTLATSWKNNVACTMEYSPVTRTVSLGQFTHPADGTYDSILVNGMEAVK
jgi:hypothetical protein